MKVIKWGEKIKPYLILVAGIFVFVATLLVIWLTMPVQLINQPSNSTLIAQLPTLSLKLQPIQAFTNQPKLPADWYIPSTVDGMAPVISRIATNQNVVFLTIDDGAYKDQSVIDLIKTSNIKASLFLSKAFIADNPGFFNNLTNMGSVIENHTLGHDTNMVKNQTYDQMVGQICGMADYELQQYGVRPKFYRPPGGAYNDDMRRAAAACGMKAIVTWVSKANGGAMQYQVGNKLRAGDIVLMHFRPEFKQDFGAFMDALKTAGLRTALLEDAIN